MLTTFENQTFKKKKYKNEKLLCAMEKKKWTLVVTVQNMYQEHGAGESIYHRISARKTPECNFPVVSTKQP